MRKIKSNYIALPNFTEPLKDAIIYWGNNKIYGIKHYDDNFVEKEGVEFYSGILVSSIISKYEKQLQSSSNIIKTIFNIYDTDNKCCNLGVIRGLDWENMLWIKGVSKIITIK